MRRERHERIVRLESLDGSTRSYYDGNGSRVTWLLQYEGLTDGERDALDGLFQECEGALLDFVFLDPAANLLRWSEDFGQSIWLKDPLLTLQPGISDPWGRTGATRFNNAGASEQRVAQTIGASAEMTFCFSLFALASGQRFRLRIDSGGIVSERAFVATTAWERYSFASNPDSSADNVTFSVVLEPGQYLSITGVQAESQPAPGGYRPTNSRSGVYPHARFATDELAWIQQAPNDNAAEIRIESRSF